jgi:exodeoxyribonuclease V alpha subunit
MADTFVIVARLDHLVWPYKAAEGFEGKRIASFQVLWKGNGAEKYVNAAGYITLQGYQVPTCPSILYDMVVEGVEHPKYGKQGNLLKVRDHEEKSREAIVKYLTCGPIKGIGKTLANRIYEKFGQETIHILNTAPDQLLKVPGIGEKKLCEMVQSRKEHLACASVMELLMPYGFSQSSCAKIAGRFGIAASDIIQSDPWRLAELPGIRFEKCDAYARAIGLHLDAESRIEQAILQVLRDNEQKGNLGEENTRMIPDLRKILGSPALPLHRLQEAADALCKEGQIRISALTGKGLIYREITFSTECMVAKLAVELSTYEFLFSEKEIDAAIEAAEKELDLTFSENQKEAARYAARHAFVIVTGGPGTGKTTTEKLIIHVLRKLAEKEKEMPYRFAMLAPTGKAAKRMTEATALPACTIDSKLSLFGEEEHLERREIEEEVTIVDEVSMLDLFRCAALLLSIRPGNRLIFVGDVDQLPSVGPGSVLKDLIEGGIPTVRLTRIYRQQGKEGAIIVENAARIQKGLTELQKDEKGFWITEETKDCQMAEHMVQAYLASCKAYGVEETVCLMPTKKTDAIGVYAMNQKIQNMVNPARPDREEIEAFSKMIFRQGDVIMNIQNDKEKNVVNGDVGRIVHCGISNGMRYVLVRYEDREVLYQGTEELRMLMLAYCMTVHKAQGSEYKSVIMGMSLSCGLSMLKRNLLYTGVTRAKKEVHLFTSKGALETAIRTTDANKRYTSLPVLVSLYREKQKKKAEGMF